MLDHTNYDQADLYAYIYVQRTSVKRQAVVKREKAIPRRLDPTLGFCSVSNHCLLSLRQVLLKKDGQLDGNPYHRLSTIDDINHRHIFLFHPSYSPFLPIHHHFIFSASSSFLPFSPGSTSFTQSLSPPPPQPPPPHSPTSHSTLPWPLAKFSSPSSPSLKPRVQGRPSNEASARAGCETSRRFSCLSGSHTSSHLKNRLYHRPDTILPPSILLFHLQRVQRRAWRWVS